MVNYYIVLAALSLTGIAGTLQAPPRFASIGAVLGLLLILLSFVFWKIDQRCAFLVKHAEAVHKLAETALLPEQARLFANEPEVHDAVSRASPRHHKPWTIGTSLRLAFAVMAIAGFGASLLCAFRAVGYLEWDRGSAHDERRTDRSVPKQPVPAPPPPR